MSNFRTRRVRTKYLKRAKKKAQIMQNAKAALRRQNWFISDTDSDILLKQRTVRYEDFTTNKVTFVDNLYSTTQTLDTCSYYDTTIKLQASQQAIPSYPTLSTQLQRRVKLNNLKVLSEKSDNIRSLFGMLFFGVHSSFFFNLFYEILRNLLGVFRYEQIFISQNLFSSLFPLTSQDSRFVLLTPSLFDFRGFDVDLKLFLLLGEALFILEETKFFNLEKHKMLFLGFVVDGIFYTKYMLLKKIKFLNLFFSLTKQFDYLISMRIDRKEVIDSFEKLSKILSAKDNDLFMEIDLQTAAEEIQKDDKLKPISLQSQKLLSKINIFQEKKTKQEQTPNVSSFSICTSFMNFGVMESICYDSAFFFGFL